MVHLLALAIPISRSEHSGKLHWMKATLRSPSAVPNLRQLSLLLRISRTRNHHIALARSKGLSFRGKLGG
jgi:hypothetical protein